MRTEEKTERQKEIQRRATRKYDSVNTRNITLKFNLRTDCDILEQLDRVENRQGYIKTLIRADMAKK